MSATRRHPTFHRCRRRWRSPPSGWRPPRPRPTSASSPATPASTSPRPRKAGRHPPPSPAPTPTRWSPRSTSTPIGAVLRRRPSGTSQLDLPAGLIENPTSVLRCSPAQFSTPRETPLRSEPLGRELPGDHPDRRRHPEQLPRRRRNQDLRRLQPQPAARASPPSSASPPTACRSRSPRTCGKRTGIRPHPGTQEPLPAARRDRLQARDLGHPLGDLPRRPSAATASTRSIPRPRTRKCPVSELKPPHASQAYLTLPTACEGPLTYTRQRRAPGRSRARSCTRRSTGSPAEACRLRVALLQPGPARDPLDRPGQLPDRLRLHPRRQQRSAAQPATRASSQIKKAVLTLPEGMTVNPSVAAGLGTCSEAQFATETITSAPGAGCPNVSKVGELIVESPIVEGPIEGSMFFATPRENRFGTLLALYLVAKAPERGLMIKVAGRVDADPDDRAPDHDLRRPAPAALLALQRPLPRRPAQPARDPVGVRQLRHRDRHQPLAATPTPSCTSPRRSPSTCGVGGGPCPQGSPPSARRRRRARSNSNASAYSPFYLHLTRSDTDQEITSYSANLPPGLLGKIAGVPFCPENLIEAAKRQTRRRIGDRSGLPGREPDRPHLHRLRRRLDPLLRARHALPRRPLPRLAALGGRDRLGQDRALRPRHGRHPLGDPDQPRRPPRSRSTRPARTRSPTSSTASRCACATSASTSTGRNS